MSIWQSYKCEDGCLEHFVRLATTLLSRSQCTIQSPKQKRTNTRLTSLCPGLPGWASTRKVEPIWILLKQQTDSGSSISWAICKSAPRSRQITTPAPHHSVFYRPDALPAAQPTASKHWRQSPNYVRYSPILKLFSLADLVQNGPCCT